MLPILRGIALRHALAPARGVRAACVTLAVLAFSAAIGGAQSKIIGWGASSFDSSFSSETFVEADAGGHFTVARRADGTCAVFGWGVGAVGQVPALPQGVNYTKVVAGSGFCIAIRDDTSIVGWPDAYAGHVPSGLTGVVDIAAGSGHALALLSNGTVMAWGENTHNQCFVPGLPLGTTYVGVGAGSIHSLAVRSDGVAVAWGNNAGGQLNVPPAPPGTSYVELSGGWYHSVGRLSDGNVVAWGLGTAGELNVPALPPGLTFTKVSAGTRNNVALRSDGAIVGWGHNQSGQCDAPALPNGMTYVDVTASRILNTVNFFNHCAALRSDGKVVTFGWNGYSQLLVPELAPGVSFVDVDSSCGGVDLGGPPVFPHTLALTSDGQALAWGDTTWGQTDVPALPPGRTYVEISAGGLHSVARRDDGVLVDWGDNSWNQLNNTPSLPDCIAVAAGSYHSLALRSIGTIVSWGYSGAGAQNVPPLPPGTAYVAIDATFFSVALRNDGQAVAWGNSNQYGQLDVPPLPPGTTYVEVAAGFYHGLARRSDGAVVAWGNNTWGQCDVPPLSPGVAYTEISAGAIYSAAKTSNGLIQVWGNVSGYKNAVPVLEPGQRFSDFEAGFDSLVARIETAWTKYCTAKVNSLGCVPAIGAQGEPNSLLPFGFTIQGANVRNQKPGLLMYTVGGAPGNLAFQCGTLCLGPGGVRRAPLGSSGGSALPTNDCSGLYQLDLNAFAAGAAGGNPDPALTISGTLVHLQWWGRDPGFAPPCNTTLTDAIEYTVIP